MITPQPLKDQKPLWHEPILLYPSSNSLDLSRRIIVEIGPGRGDFLFHLAESNPDALVYGIELKTLRFYKLVERRDARSLNNITLLKGDARIGLPEMFGSEHVDEIHIQFPDPWPKRRHEPCRLVNDDFTKNCVAVMKPGAELYFVTDVDWYAADVSKRFLKAGLKPCYEPVVTTDLPDAFETFFFKKWKAMGRTAYYQKYVK